MSKSKFWLIVAAVAVFGIGLYFFARKCKQEPEDLAAETKPIIA